MGDNKPSFLGQLRTGLKRIVLARAVFVVLVVLTGLWLKRPNQKVSPNVASSTISAPSALPTVEISASSKRLFGTMLAFNINDAASGAPGKANTLQAGWTEFKKDSSAYESLKANLGKIIQNRTKLVQETGFSVDRELVPYFTWNVVEPKKGEFDWGLTDMYAQGAVNAGVNISAVIQPFAAWDQADTVPLATCNALDFAYYDYKVGPPHDLTEYENFLTKTVLRYKDRVAVWEIGNEYDGPCGGYQDNPRGYFDLLKVSSETIKKVDPKAMVTNGAASEVAGSGPGTSSVKNFWQQFFTLGGSRYIDYFNFHYNTERSQTATLDPATFQQTLTFLNELMDKNGGKKPFYLTEFGVYAGASSQPAPMPIGPAQGQPQQVAPAPMAQGPPNQAGPGLVGNGPNLPAQSHQTQTDLPDVSEDAQAALYFKDSVLVLANGAHLIFIDLTGGDNDMIGSSMAFNIGGQPRLFLTTLQALTTRIGGFSGVNKITDSQYKFTVDGKSVYALWAGTLPGEISGQVTVTDLRGHEQTIDASAVTLRADQPVIITP